MNKPWEVSASSPIMVLLVLLIPVCQGWSIFGRRSPLPPRKTQLLVDHLVRGASRVNEGVSVVSVAKNECGIQMNGRSNRELAYVDRAEFITPKCGLETAVGRAVETYFSLHDDVKAPHGAVLPSIYIAIFLCLTKEDRMSGGDFAPYLRTLPSMKSLQHLPLFWSQSQLDELQNSVVKGAVLTRRREWKEEHFHVLAAIREAGGLPEKDFVSPGTWLWARSIIASRSFTDDATEALCLVPYVDMMNHISPGQADSCANAVKCDWIIDAKGFRLMMPEGELLSDQAKRIEISYGSHSNSNFLINYGFSIVDDEHQTPQDKVTLSLSLPVEGSEPVEKLWEADGLGDCHDIQRNVTVSIGDPGPMNSVLSLCRVASCQGHELNDMQDEFLKRGEKTSQTEDGFVPQLGATLCRSPFSVRNEVRAMEMLQQVALDSLSSYKTTLEEDEHILMHGLTWRRRWFGRENQKLINALIVRRGEKRILQHYYNVSTIALRFLEMANVDFETYKGMLTATLENEEVMVS